MSAPGLPLRDIHLPAEPGWWPPAPGWWLLAAAGLVLLLLLLRWLHASWVHSRRRRLRLETLESLLRTAGDAPASRLRAAAEAIRRVAWAERGEHLPLHGEAWVRYLDEGLADLPFSHDAADLILQAPYRADVSKEEADRLVSLVRRRLNVVQP